MTGGGGGPGLWRRTRFTQINKNKEQFRSHDFHLSFCTKAIQGTDIVTTTTPFLLHRYAIYEYEDPFSA